MDKKPPTLSSSCAGCSRLIVDDPMPRLVRDFIEYEWDDPPDAGIKVTPVDLCTPCQLAKTFGKYGTLREGIFQAVSAIAVAPAAVLTQGFVEEVFVGLVRHGLFSTDPDWREEDPLTFHVDPVTDPSGWDAVRAEFARMLWLHRERLSFPELAARVGREFGPDVMRDALQLVACEALDECVLLARLSEVREPGDFRSTSHPSLRYSVKDLRAERKNIASVEQFLAFLECLEGRLEAQTVAGKWE